MIITRAMLRDWNACYTDERLAEVVPDEGLTPRQVAELPIPVEDRLWVLLREEVLPHETLRLLACRWARQALELVPAEQRDPRSLAAIDTSERYALGEATDEELAAARAAAWAAAWDAARGTARDAAWNAARTAAWDAAWAAARDAARDAAWAAQLVDVVGELP